MCAARSFRLVAITMPTFSTCSLSNPAIRHAGARILERPRASNAVFHYVPLHSSGAGRRFGRTSGPLRTTDAAAARLIRLPLWMGMDEDDVDRVVAVIQTALE